MSRFQRIPETISVSAAQIVIQFQATAPDGRAWIKLVPEEVCG